MLCLRLVSASCLAVALLLGGSAVAQAGSRYYVDPSGSNRDSGRSPSRAWRTIARVNRATLEPGDVVAFRGGRKFGGAPLIPQSSGSPGASIRYRSFGRRQATLTQGVFLYSIAWITIDGLRIRGAGQGIASGVEGSGARHIRLLHNAISDVQIGINSPNARDTAWRIAHNRITRTGDSGLILQGADITVKRNGISSTGNDRRINYAKHGIYAKGPRITMLGNRIKGFATEGISTRFRDALIVDNVIEKGEGGVGYYPDDSSAGTTVIRGNTISRVDYGIYIAPDGTAGLSRERFRVVANTILTRGPAIDAPAGGGRVEASGNRVQRTPSRERATAPAQAGQRSGIVGSAGGGLGWPAGLAALALALVIIASRRVQS
jgi:hypothetical protein